MSSHLVKLVTFKVQQVIERYGEFFFKYTGVKDTALISLKILPFASKTRIPSSLLFVKQL